jgi:hypothetical protein
MISMKIAVKQVVAFLQIKLLHTHLEAVAGYKSVCIRGSCDRPNRPRFPVVFQVLEQTLSWHPKSTLHCSLIIQPYQRDQIFFIMLPSKHKIRPKCSTSFICCILPGHGSWYSNQAKGWKIPGLNPSRGRIFFLLPTTSRRTVGSAEPPTQRILKALSPVQLTFHLHEALRLKMTKALPIFPFRYELDGLGIESRRDARFSAPVQDRPWGPPSLL